MEKWAYELAKTFYKAGMEQECIRECSDIILWFGEGIYVEKAKMLRSYFSGETDKEKLMEELKRRSMEDTGTIDSEKIKVAQAEQEASKLEGLEEEGTDSYEEDIYSATDFTIEEETVEFEDGLKKDVQNILIEGWEDESEYENSASYEEEYIEREVDTNSEEGYEWQETIESEQTKDSQIEDEVAKESEESKFCEEDTVTPLLRQDTTIYDDEYGSKSNRELAEQEVEAAIYQLLQEEDMDEDDKKLNQIAEELNINLGEIFGNFSHVKSVKRQLVKSLESIMDEHTKTVQMIITGTVGSGKTTLAKDITMFLNKAGKLKSSKIAKIKAEKLNIIDIASKKDTLRDCCLVVENASELERQTIDSLLELCYSLQGNIAVIFEENKKNVNKLFRECPKLMDLFKNRIHLPEYTQEDLVGFAYACLRQQEYRLDPKALSVLHHKINQIAKQSEPHRQLEQICSQMRMVMDAADIRTGKQLSNLASQGELKVVEVLTVLPEDFATRI
jgi:ABC-type antimicrobial peptide transport system ATPase subunit